MLLQSEHVVDYDIILEEYQSLNINITSEDKNPYSEEDLNDDDIFGPSSSEPQTKKHSPKSTTPVLDNFGRDMTALAESNKLDPVIGREKEIQRVSKGKSFINLGSVIPIKKHH